MKKALRVILSGLAATGAGYAAILALRKRRPERNVEKQRPELLDLNTCSREQLATLSLRTEVLDRIVENRPYRNKLDLLSRLVLPQAEYEQISHRVAVRDPEEPVKVA